jgi:DNA repair photolyase
MSTPAVRPDGTPKGAEVIYAPRGQAGEYAPLATNPFRGCGHGCAYCYVPRVTKQDRRDFNAGAVVRKEYMAKVQRDCRRYQAAGITDQVMLSFTTDPYPLGVDSGARDELSLVTRNTLLLMREHGVGFCTLTKAGTAALVNIDLFRPETDAFACSLTSLDDRFSKKWEPRAAGPNDRIEALRQFHEAGIFTWVSLEPTLDTYTSKQIVRETCDVVDLYKVGRANYLPITKTTDWQRYTQEMLDVLNEVGAEHYIKKDLQRYLPDGYHNPMRRPQHK